MRTDGNNIRRRNRKKAIKKKRMGDIFKACAGTVGAGFVLLKSIGYEDGKGCDFHWGFFIVGIMLVVMLVGVLAVADKRENEWAFVLTLPVFLPLNIKMIVLSCNLLNYVFFSSHRWIFYMFNISVGILIFMILLSLEEIMVGILVRLVWKRQRKSFVD